LTPNRSETLFTINEFTTEKTTGGILKKGAVFSRVEKKSRSRFGSERSREAEALFRGKLPF